MDSNESSRVLARVLEEEADNGGPPTLSPPPSGTRITAAPTAPLREAPTRGRAVDLRLEQRKEEEDEETKEEVSQLIAAHTEDCESCSQERRVDFFTRHVASTSHEPSHPVELSAEGHHCSFYRQDDRKQYSEIVHQEQVIFGDHVRPTVNHHHPYHTLSFGPVQSAEQQHPQAYAHLPSDEPLDESPKWCFFGPPSAWEKCDTPHDGPCTPYCRRSKQGGQASLVRTQESDCNQSPLMVPDISRHSQHCVPPQDKVGPCLHGSSKNLLIGHQPLWHDVFLEDSAMKSLMYKDIIPTKREEYQIMFDSRWSDLMDEMLWKVFEQLSLQDAKHCRLVCHSWRNIMDYGTEELKLSWLKSKIFILRFPFLRKLDLTRCSSIRNKDLAAVSDTTGKLQELYLGSALTPPLITNKGLEQLKPMHNLAALSLNECRAVTNNGLAALTSLKGLHTLSLRGCVAVTNKGVQQIGHIASLTSLNLFGCVRVGDGGMEHLTSLTSLRHLFLGKTKVRDEGLYHIGKCTTLRELFIFSEDVNDAGIIELAPLVNLERLTLRETFSLEGNGVEELVQKVTGLRHLDLCNSEMDDEQFINATYDWCKLESLDLRGCFISDSALYEVTQLTTLKSLSIEPFWELPIPPQTNFMFSSFSSLTHLVLVGDSVTVEMIAAVGMLPKLVELSIGDHVFSENLLSRQPLNDGVVSGLTALTRLTSLDVSRQWLTKDQIVLLADKLHNLRELCVFDCKATEEELVLIQQQFPHIKFHKHIMKDGVLDVKHAPGDVWAGQPGFF